MSAGTNSFFDSVAHLLTEAERKQLTAAGMGRSSGFGSHPALLVIDAQNYMVGPATSSDKTHYPSACAGAREVAPVIVSLARAFRSKSLPVIYTRQVARADAQDMGVKRLKRGVLNIEGWYIDGTKGAELSPLVEPQPQDIVLPKLKQSGFYGTPLLGLLIDMNVDTLVITGGSTSNCIRATAIDSSSYNFRTIVPHDAVFDRIRISHEVNLMDIARQLGDVVSAADVIHHVGGIAMPQRRNLNVDL
jgi:maleamate amidohydrolase